MSFQRLTAGFLAAAVAGWVSTAAAADGEYGRSGPYLGAGGTFGIENFDGGGADNGWGYNLKGGYRFNEIFAVEVEWEQLPGFDAPGGDIDVWALTANGKAFLTNGPIQPFALAGMGWMGTGVEGGDDESNVGFRFGAGIDFYATRNIAFTAEAGYILGLGDVGDYDLVPVSIGILYRFY